MTAVGVHENTATYVHHRIEPIPRVSIHAFCESPEVAALIEAAAADRRLAKAHIRHNMGGAAAAIEAYQIGPTPNVIVLEAPLEESNLIERLDALALLCDSGTKVVVLGSTNDIVLYRQLVARGVNEYLVAPVHVVDFLRAISELFRTPGAKPLGRLIGVVGAKGGVGASTIAHNLAWSLAAVTEMATIVADFDLAFGTAALNFNQDPPQGVADAVFDPDRVDATLVDRVLSKCGERLSLLAAPAVLDRVLDFPETSFDTLLELDARGGALVRSRHPSCLERMGATHSRRRRRSDGGRQSGSRQPAQHEKSDRPAEGGAPARPSAPTRSQRGGHDEAAGNFSSRVRQNRRRRAGRHHRARRETVRVGCQQWSDDRRGRAEGKDRTDLYRSSGGGRGTQGRGEGQERLLQSACRKICAHARVRGFGAFRHPAPAAKKEVGDVRQTRKPGSGAPPVPAGVVIARAAAEPVRPPPPPASAPSERKSDAYYQTKSLIFSALIEAIDLAALSKLDTDAAREEIRDIVHEIVTIKNLVLSIAEQEDLLDDICNDVLGYGPLEPLLARDDIADIMVNGPARCFIEVGGKIQLTSVRFRDNAQLMNICQRIVSQVGRRSTNPRPSATPDCSTGPA